eukprot:105662-Rhodomonas_salina.2
MMKSPRYACVGTRVSEQIKELPCEMGDLKEKVLLHLNLDDNPLKDSKVRVFSTPMHPSHIPKTLASQHGHPRRWH